MRLQADCQFGCIGGLEAGGGAYLLARLAGLILLLVVITIAAVVVLGIEAALQKRYILFILFF